jgi:3-oxoacyl-ACP reductase-like protein
MLLTNYASRIKLQSKRLPHSIFSGPNNLIHLFINQRKSPPGSILKQSGRLERSIVQTYRREHSTSSELTQIGFCISHTMGSNSKSLPLTLAGKVAIVTGGSRGIGAAIAWEFAQRGAKASDKARRPLRLGGSCLTNDT